MAILKILTKEDPALSKVCHAVTKFDNRLWALLEDMRDTLIDSNGVGLAAPQIGIIRRVVLVINDQDEIMELINPEILEQSGEQEGFESMCAEMKAGFQQVISECRDMGIPAMLDARYAKYRKIGGETV